MRIAIDIRKIGKNSTGDETYTTNLIWELVKNSRSKKHSFLLLTDADVSGVKKILVDLPENFQIKKVVPVNKLFWTFYSLPRFLKNNPVDVLHVQYIGPFLLDKKIKLVTTVHDISFKINPAWIAPKDSFLLNKFIPPTLRRADRIITVSEFSKKEIEKNFGVSAKKIVVTSPAVSKKTLSLLTKQWAKAKIQKKFSFVGDYFLHISSLQPRKNVAEIIKGFGLFKKKNPSKIKLLIVGKQNGHNYDYRIEQALCRSDFKKDIIFTGYASGDLLPDLYRGARAFIFPSSYEGFGLPLLESLINETPVIASEEGSLEEVGGKAVFYLNRSKDKDMEISRLMQKIVDDRSLVKQKIELGKDRIAFYSWKTMAEKTLEVYESLCN